MKNKGIIFSIIGLAGVTAIVLAVINQNVNQLNYEVNRLNHIVQEIRDDAALDRAKEGEQQLNN